MIPADFLERMRALLDEEAYNAFLSALSYEQSVHAVRHNAEKMDREAFLQHLSSRISPIGYTQDGFFCDLSKIGHHPFHHAGAIYSQDPGAMAPLACLDVKEGILVADFCASPGGKSTQLAALIGNSGVIVSNEINLSRCKVLAGNIERLGIKNAFVTNVPTDELAKWYSACFDLVVVDAPCSGEGMFRKYDHAGDEWSPSAVLACAERQAEILQNAAKTVKSGGYLLYSTCTFSLEENEMNVDAFLEKNPSFHVAEVKETVRQVTANGIAFAGAKHPYELIKARRFYPHLHPGEGQFMCLLQKEDDGSVAKVCYEDSKASMLSKDERAIVEEFLKGTLLHPLSDILPNHILKKQGEVISLVPKKLPLPPHHAYLSGVSVGTVQKGRLEPHHHYFSAMGRFFARKIDLALDSREILAYLHGETLSVDCPNGYAVVTVAGAAVGGVKVVNGVAKNHYPKGLRIP